MDWVNKVEEIINRLGLLQWAGDSLMAIIGEKFARGAIGSLLLP